MVTAGTRNVEQRFYEDLYELVALLQRRPITEPTALQVAQFPGFADLTIRDGDWMIPAPHERDAYMTSEEHGWIESLLLTALTNWAIKHRTGRVYPGDTDFVLDGTPDDIRLRYQPDVSFVRTERLQKTPGYYYGAPDVAFEIVSPSQTKRMLVSKASDYLRFGSQAVGLVLPEQESIEVYSGADEPQRFVGDDLLTIPDVLPDFTLRVNTLFEDE